MFLKPTKLELCLNAEKGGFHDLLVQRTPQPGTPERGMQLVEKPSFAYGDVRAALQAVVDRMERHRISIATIVDPGHHVLKASGRSDLQARQIRAFITQLATAR